MQFFKLITTIYLLAASACAAANFEGEFFEVSDVKVDRVFSGNFSISFTVYDPDPLTNATQECSGSWAYGSNGYPKASYVRPTIQSLDHIANKSPQALCGNSTFGWNMAKFTGYQKFTLGLQHKFSDPSVGEPPYDSVTTYGNAIVNRRNLACEKDGESVTCSQTTDVIEAPIDRVSS